MTEKKCFKCKLIKPLEDFYRHKKMYDGHLNKCKTCTKRDVTIYRRENDSVREYDRYRYYANEYRQWKTRDNTEKWNENNPLGYKAHTIVNNAIRDGKLIRQPCSICGDTKSHAHHKDYNSPLEVEWFCARHHSKIHNPETF